jgi:hypothetical protein
MTKHLCRAAALLLLSGVCSQFAVAQVGSFTLYSPLKYKKEKRDFCFDFVNGASQRHADPCDLRYGMLYAGDEWDWFQSSTPGTRSVIKDLGPRSWNEAFKVPAVKPLPKLLPAERRNISVDVSGADGDDGAPGEPGAPGADGDGVIRQRTPPTPIVYPPRKKKHDGKPKIDPAFVKAVVGHMYVIRIVDDHRDFYALFRVEALERGDHCVVSWKTIDAPQDVSPRAN